MADTPVLSPERDALLRALAAQAAAWWRHKLEGHGYLSDFDNGDRSPAGETMQVMASLAALRAPRPESSRFERFEQLLTANVLEHLLRHPAPERPTSYTLDVDYGPSYQLGSIAHEAGVSGFPWKTTMWVCWGPAPEQCYVEVKCGYGQPTQRLPTPPAAPAPLAAAA